MINSLLNWKRTIQVSWTFMLLGWATPVLGGSAHILIDVQNNALVKKAQWQDFHRAESGMTLSGEDKIKLTSNASVTVYCGDRNKWTVNKPGTYTVSQGCPQGEKIVSLSQDFNNMTTRNTVIKEKELKKLPYLISPRNTYIFNDSLTIRWNEVSGATNYKVKVEDWERETKDNQIIYDGELESGEYYRMTVVADNGAASKDEDYTRTIWFIVLEDEEAKTLREQVEAIEQDELNQDQKGLILAHFYIKNQLYFEAIQVLEELVKSGSQALSVHKLLGDIYQQVGLNLMAKEIYQQGLGLTVEENNSEVKGTMEWSLGAIEYFLGNKDKAVKYLRKAKASYLVLGEYRRVKQLAEWINKVSGD